MASGPIWRTRVPDVIIGTAILLLTLAVFGQTAGFDYLYYDDNVYVTENPDVARGLTWRGLWAALTQPQNAGWTPLSTLSLMVDVECFGMRPGPSHVVNYILHAIGAFLLFAGLRQLSLNRWISAVVALGFAVHPLHVEPVAWISSRKDVLSGCLFMVALIVYARYVMRPRRPLYLAMVFIYATALMAKPTVITLPVLFLLLDYWPLRRVSHGTMLFEDVSLVWSLLREKIPMFAISALVGIVTIWAQISGSAVKSINEYGISSRITNALISYINYLKAFLWPVGLAPYYPHLGDGVPALQPLAAGLFLVTMTALGLYLSRRAPYLIVGWLWFVIGLLPTIGIIQIGSFSRADRFMYLPLIGLMIVVTLASDALTKPWPRRRHLLGPLWFIVIAVWAGVAWWQTGHWRNTELLFSHALRVTLDNPVARNNLAVAYLRKAEQVGDGGERSRLLAQAEEHLREAVRLDPAFVDSRNNLGIVLDLLGKPGAVEQFLAVLRDDPNNVDALVNFGNALQEERRYEEAIAQYRHALTISPQDREARYNLGVALVKSSRHGEAAEAFREVIRLDPNHVRACVNLANCLVVLGSPNEALRWAEEAVRQEPESAEAHYNVGLALHFLGRSGEAAGAFRRAVECDPAHADAHYNLGVVLATLNRGAEAVHHFEEAIRLDPGKAEAREALRVLRGQLAGGS